MKDLYNILQVSKQATLSEIKQQYRKLAFATHPDKNKSKEAIEQFKDVSEAYEILSKTDKRHIYDTCGYDCVRESNAVPINPFELFRTIFNVDFTSHMNTNVFFFSDVSPWGMKGSPTSLIHTLDVSLDELYKGTQKEFSVETKDSDGAWRQTKYVLNIKPGTHTKETLIVPSGGHYQETLQKTDDLIVQLQELSHPLYKRQGDDLVREHVISLCDALCGPTIYMTHFDKSLQVDIDSIVKPNCLYKIYGQGMPIKQTNPSLSDKETSEADKGAGDLILDLTIEFPEHLSDKRKEYIQQLLGSKETNTHTTKEESLCLQAYYYKDKQDIVKELLEEEDNSGGCLQQ